MSALHLFGTVILGLGLFFLGMQLVGDNLRRLSSASLTPLGVRMRRAPWTAPAKS